MAGICLIRMGSLRPAVVPVPVGWRGEAAAHRIAVERNGEQGVEAGVFIPRRHSASWLPVLAGGRVFPGVHRHARFDVAEDRDRYRIAVDGADESVRVEARAVPIDEWSSSLFAGLGEASDFFRAGSVGWSPSRSGGALEGLALRTTAWRVQPASVEVVRSSFFDRLPSGAAAFDDALLMTGVPVTWDAAGSRAGASAELAEQPSV